MIYSCGTEVPCRELAPPVIVDRPVRPFLPLADGTADFCLGIFMALNKQWWAHLGSNQGPTGYEPVALPVELWALSAFPAPANTPVPEGQAVPDAFDCYTRKGSLSMVYFETSLRTLLRGGLIIFFPEDAGNGRGASRRVDSRSSRVSSSV